MDSRFADIHERLDRIEPYAADLARDKRISKLVRECVLSGFVIGVLYTLMVLVWLRDLGWLHIGWVVR